MIDCGEEKQTFGAPKIDVGPVAQLLTALYLGGAVAAFFAPRTVRDAFAQINAELPRRFWTLLTGTLVFPESFEEFARVPAGFWVVVTFLLIFFVARPLELAWKNNKAFLLFLFVFMTGPSLVLWALDPAGEEVAAGWPFWFSAASGLAAVFFRRRRLSVAGRAVPQSFLYAAVPAVAALSSLANGRFVRCGLYLLCALLGALWGFAVICRERSCGTKTADPTQEH
jgi:hypothetical protein